MKKLLVIACSALPFVVGCAGAVDDGEQTAQQSDAVNVISHDVLVDFDEVNGTPIPNNSIVDTTYAANGVTFSCVVCTSGHAYARALGNGTQGVSLIDPNASILPFFDARDGAVTATFNTPRNWVSIDAAPVLPPEFVGTPTNMPWIEAYDASGNLLTKTLYPIAYGQAGYGTEQTLTVSSPGNIKTVRFSSRHDSGPAVYGTFDNLRFNGDLILIPLPPPRLHLPIQ
ncbi:MAG TPA: hypothetical protein VMI54_06935 [Polyangiaceae bacterium]|nr:hypothetical protein [Polyangiaceae bacterium]